MFQIEDAQFGGEKASWKDFPGHFFALAGCILQ